MTPERLKVLGHLYNRVLHIERDLERHRERAKAEQNNPHLFDSCSVSPAARQRADKIIEQDLEEQLALAKQEFERAA